LAKKLKRRIKEVCGLDSLKKDERVKRAREILEDPVEKQAICHKIVGASHKDVEKALQDIIVEKKGTKQQQEYEELEEEYPEKIYPELQIMNRQKAAIRMNEYTPEECLALVQESSASKAIQEVFVERPLNYSTYSFAEVAALAACNYNPVMFKGHRD
jgi:hypothetical protein